MGWVSGSPFFILDENVYKISLKSFGTQRVHIQNIWIESDDRHGFPLSARMLNRFFDYSASWPSSTLWKSIRRTRQPLPFCGHEIGIRIAD